MNCEQRRDLMPLLLVEALEPAEAAALRAHLATGCPRCSSYLAEADAILAHLPFALEPIVPQAEARDRLMERVAQHAPTVATHSSIRLAEPHRGGLRLMPRWMRAVLPAAVAACIVFIATVQYMLRMQHSREEQQRAQFVKVEQRAQELAAQAQRDAQITRVIYSSNKQFNLEGPPESKAVGRAMWDDQRKAWHFRAFNLKQLGPREAYELWFVTPYGRKVPTATTFKPDEHGDAYIVVSLPKDVGPVSGAFVTDEPSVGTFQPTGEVHLSGRLE